MSFVSAEHERGHAYRGTTTPEFCGRTVRNGVHVPRTVLYVLKSNDIYSLRKRRYSGRMVPSFSMMSALFFSILSAVILNKDGTIWTCKFYLLDIFAEQCTHSVTYDRMCRHFCLKHNSKYSTILLICSKILSTSYFSWSLYAQLQL